MKRLFKRAAAICLSAVMTASMFVTGAVSTAVTTSALTTNDYYNSYTTVADIKNRDGCSAMQGMAVGSTYLYTVKTKPDNSGAVLQKTNKNTGATTNLTNSTGSIYTYLNHANDMDVTTIDGYSQLFVATMATGSNSLVRIKVDGSKATKSGGYTLMYNGSQKSVSGVAVEWTDANNVCLLLKSGATVYRATVPKAATSGTINIAKAFTLNTSSVKVNGSYVNLSSYTHQGMGYHDGKIYVPLWGGGAGKSNQAVIAVYDTYDATGKTLTSDPFLSFRVTSGAYSGFEIESCDISSDGQMYFNVNRWTASSGNYDAILRFNGFVANGFNPDGCTDVISGGQGSVTVRGWAFDKDCTPMSIPVHVYIGGPAGSGEGHAITANTYRSDVNGSFGCGDYHGFDATIGTSLRGSQPVYIYAINTRKGTNVMIGSGWVNITSDTNPPGIGNVRITEVSDSGYRVTCDVWDDSGVTSVKFPTWTANNGQDDLIWHEGSISGNTATCYISRGDHKGEYGTYYTHIYAYDGYGNQSCNGDTNVYLEQPLSIYNYGIADLGTGFYARIGNVGTNKNIAIDLSNNNVILHDKIANADQTWRFDRYADGSYKITNTYNGECLDVVDCQNGDGVNVGLWQDLGNSAQKWYIYDYCGKYVLKAVCSDRVLDVVGGQSANFTNIQTWTFNASGAQQFTIDKVNDYKGVVADLGTGFYARIGNVGTNKNIAIDLSNNNVILHDKIANADQTWRFDRYADGSYKITNTYNGECLDVVDCQNGDGVNVGLWKDLGNSAQKWYIYDYCGKYVLKAVCSDRVLDVAGGQSANFTNIQTWTFNASGAQLFEINKIDAPVNLGDDFYANISYAGKNLSLNGNNVVLYHKTDETQQKWHFTRNSDGTYKIMNLSNNKCLDVNACSSEAGANVQVWDDYGNTAQRWNIYDIGGGKYMFRAVCTETCSLDVADNGLTHDGNNILQWTYWGGEGQKFEINKIDAPVNLGDDFYANISYAGKNLSLNGNNVVLYHKTDETQQKWHFTRNSDGTYKIMNLSNNKCLDVNNCSSEAGANVQVWDDYGNTAQRWNIYAVGGGKYMFRAVCTETCSLDVADNGLTHDGNNILQWTYWGGEGQKFEINKF